MSRIQIILFILGCYAVKESWTVACKYYSNGILGLRVPKYRYCSDSCCIIDTSSCCYYNYAARTLSGGLIAGVVVGTLVPIIIIVIVVAYLCWRKRTTNVIVAGQPAGVTVTTANTSQMVAVPGYSSQSAAAPAYNIPGGYPGQVNAGESQLPPKY